MSDKRIYLVITPFFPEHDCFGGSYVEDQVKAIMRQSGYQVLVMMPQCWWNSDSADYEIHGIKVYRFIEWCLPSNFWPNALTDYLTACSIVKKIKSIGLDIRDVEFCHSHVTRNGAYGEYLKKWNPKIISIVQHHGFDVMGIADGRFSKFRIHEKHCIKHGVNICNKSDLNIGVSQKTLDYVLKQPGINLKNKYVLYNGVNTDIFNPDKKMSKNACGEFKIGCVGNFWELKDQITLIKAVELIIKEGITDICVSFVGRGYNFDNCYNYVMEHDLSKYFYFTKELEHDHLPGFYHSLDLFVLPSYWEAFGCVYTEAYACGVPFIGVKGQGIAEIIIDEDKERWLIDKGDFEKLAEIILNFMNAPKEQRLSVPYEIDKLIDDYLVYLQTI